MKRILAIANDVHLTWQRNHIRWSWVLAVALGTFLGLLIATLLGETGAMLGEPPP
jgi:hypothetical protein